MKNLKKCPSVETAKTLVDTRMKKRDVSHFITNTAPAFKLRKKQFISCISTNIYLETFKGYNMMPMDNEVIDLYIASKVSKLKVYKQAMIGMKK